MTALTDRIDALLAASVAAAEVPGVIAAAATADEVLYEGAAGMRQAGGTDAMTTDTVVWIASMTKAVTGTAAMQLVEQGKLSLDDPIAPVLPQLADVQVLDGFDADGNPQLRPPKRPVTLRHLLTHTSGFSYNMWSEPCLRYEQVTGNPGILTCTHAALDMPLMFDPGERWEYGIGIDFAGLAVEAISGQTLAEYLRDHLFVPLGMADTGFGPRPEQAGRLASVHARTPDGLLPIEFGLPAEPEFHMGGGGLYGTVGDYLRFCRMLLGKGTLEGTKVLEPATVELMGSNAIGAVDMAKMTTCIPDYTHDVDLFPGMAKKWGLTFMINTEDTGRGRRAGSLAWAGLANSYYWIDPTSGVAGVLATQIFPFADPTVLELLDRFEAAVYQG
ncbi:MAG: serine hydrolase domain-containing protein [Acidimicrobiia bacterium]